MNISIRFRSRGGVICAMLVFASLAVAQPEQPAEMRNVVVERTGSQKWALLIGVDDYLNANDLAYCGRDVAALRERQA